MYINTDFAIVSTTEASYHKTREEKIKLAIKLQYYHSIFIKTKMFVVLHASVISGILIIVQ